MTAAFECCSHARMGKNRKEWGGDGTVYESLTSVKFVPRASISDNVLERVEQDRPPLNSLL